MVTRVAGLHLAALWAFAFVQPLFDLLGRQAEFFVARGNTAADIVAFALIFTLVPPALMGLAVWILGRARPALGWALQLLLVGLLVAATALPPVADLLAGSSLSIMLALLLGGAVAVAYSRAPGVRTLLTVLSPAPIVFLLLFLVVSPVSRLVFPSGEAEAVTGAARSDTPVVMVVFDELPTTSLMDARGRIDARRFPAFASLAEEAVWYRNATTVAAYTTQAIPALMTGERLEEGLLPTSDDLPRSLFTLLGRSHRLEIVEPITDICPSELCSEARPGMGSRLQDLTADLRVVSAHLLLPDDLRGGLPAIDRAWAGFDDEGARAEHGSGTSNKKVLPSTEVARRLDQDDPAGHLRILGAVERDSSRPLFLFLHSTLPHGPWRFLPDGSQYTLERGEFPGLVDKRWSGAQWLVNQAFQRHLLQTQYADELLGQLLKRLRSNGLYDQALVVVAADHGVSFRAGEGYRAPTADNFQDITGVPLFVKSPGQRDGSVDKSAARTIDVFPTIAKELGIELPWRVDGVPAVQRGDSTDIRIDVAIGTASRAMSFGELLRQREARRRYERSLLQASGYDVFAMGPRPELVGRRVETIGTLRAGPARVRLDDPESFAAVQPTSGVIPAFISGAVVGLAGGTELAVALNGRIEATTRVQRSSGESHFTALVRPESLRRDPNAVAVFEVVGRQLRLLGRVAGGAPYELAQGNGGEALVRGRERIPVQAAATAGYIDFAQAEGLVVKLIGWAATDDRTRPARRVVAVAGQRALDLDRPSLPREDLSKSGRTLRAGFQLVVPRAELAFGDLRVFAIAHGRASELAPVGNVPGVLASLRAG